MLDESVSFHMRLKVSVICEDSTEQSLYFEVYPDSDSVMDLKHMVATKIGTSPDALEMIFHGQNMSDDFLLSAYKVQRYRSYPVYARRRTRRQRGGAEGPTRGYSRPMPIYTRPSFRPLRGGGGGGSLCRLHGKKCSHGW